MSSRDNDRNEPSFSVDLEAPYERVYDEPPPPPRAQGRRKLFGAVVAVAALAGFAGIAWYATRESQRDPSAVVPVITAESDPIKERPKDPGGLEIPNRGMQVFNQITPDKEPQKVERLLAPAETPVERPKAEAVQPPTGPLVPDAPAIAARDGAGPATTAPTPPPPPKGTAQEVAKAPVAKSVIHPDEAAAKAAAPKPKPAPAQSAKAVPPPATAGGGWQVQFGASQNEARAKATVARLAGANKDLLGGLQTSVARANLGAKGTFFRMRAGPLKDRAAAEALCGKLKARKIGCLVVKP